MALSNNERVGKALDLLTAGLAPFIQREMQAVHGTAWLDLARQALRDDRSAPADVENWDAPALLSVMINEWNRVFRYALGPAERSLAHEIKGVRNAWAHQQNFSTDDAERGLDSIRRLLQGISAPEAQEVERLRNDLLRRKFDEQARYEHRRATSVAVEGTPAAGFRPWREIVTPHPDVASGRFQQAEFAADLAQVHRGEGGEEYQNSRSFFARTYVTEGLRQLLTNALLRLDTGRGDPVVELQTNFGGGKTHSMLALYHLFSGVPATELPGIESVLQSADGARPVRANRAVLVGTALSPADVRKKDDGTVTHTLWGEMAHQLLGKEGYALVAESDRKGVSPGSDTLRELFRKAAPCLVLIDEWVAFLRSLYKVEGLPAGSFENNMTFAHALTEAAKAAPNTLVVASIPASNIEIGGEGVSRHWSAFSTPFRAWSRPGDPPPPRRSSRSCVDACSSPSLPTTHPRATPWSAASRSSTATRAATSRPSAARADTSDAFRRPIRSTRSCSIGSSTTGRRWTPSSAPAACCGSWRR